MWVFAFGSGRNRTNEVAKLRHHQLWLLGGPKVGHLHLHQCLFSVVNVLECMDAMDAIKLEANFRQTC